MPKHVSNIIEVPGEERVVAAIPAYDFETEKKKIHEIEVLETWTGGKQIYKRGESV